MIKVLIVDDDAGFRRFAKEIHLLRSLKANLHMKKISELPSVTSSRSNQVDNKKFDSGTKIEFFNPLGSILAFELAMLRFFASIG